MIRAKRLAEAEVGRVQNEMARDSYSYLHFLLVAGIVLVALGLKKTLGHVEDPLKTVPEFALLGGVAIYLLGHVAIRLRNIGTLNRQRLGMAILLTAAIPVAVEFDALVVLVVLTAAVWTLIAFETRRYGEARTRLRAELAHGR